MTHSMTPAKATDPAAASQRNTSSLSNTANISRNTEKSRLATFFNTKSAHAACAGVFHPLADLIFCAFSTSKRIRASHNAK